jgi:hypothetical protein
MKIEQEIDQKLDRSLHRSNSTNRRQNIAKNRSHRNNVFFPGLSAEANTTTESGILSALQEDGDAYDSAILTKKHQLWFCLPCDIKDEVHSKPPGSYT